MVFGLIYYINFQPKKHNYVAPIKLQRCFKYAFFHFRKIMMNFDDQNGNIVWGLISFEKFLIEIIPTKNIQYCSKLKNST